MQPTPAADQTSLEIQLARATALLRAANLQLGRDFGTELQGVKLSAIDEILANEALLPSAMLARRRES